MNDPQGILEEFASVASLHNSVDEELVIWDRHKDERLGFNSQSNIHSKKTIRLACQANRRIPDEDVRAIRSAMGPSQAIADRFGVSRGSVLKIRKGETYKDVE